MNHDDAHQRRVNTKMRDPKNVEEMLFRARRATPASPEQVREFLATAPPEFLVLIDAVSARNAGRTPSMEDELDELARRRLEGDPITAGLVAVLLRFQGDRASTQPHEPITTVADVVRLSPRPTPLTGSSQALAEGELPASDPEQGLRYWARGISAQEVAVELLIVFSPGRLLDGPWVRPGQLGSFWFDTDLAAVEGGHLSSGERRVLGIASSLASAERPVDLGDAITGLDPSALSLVLDSPAHAGGRE